MNRQHRGDQLHRRGVVSNAAILCALLLPACSETVVEVTVDARSNIASINRLEVVVTNDGDSVEETFDVSEQTFPLTFTVTPANRSGDIAFQLRALSVAGDLLGVANANTNISDGATASVSTRLNPADFLVNSDSSGVQRHAFRLGRNGRAISQTPTGFAVAFVNDCTVAATCDVFVRQFDNDGKPLALGGSTVEVAMNAVDYPVVSVPSIAANTNGDIAAVWETADAIFLSVLSASGATVVRDAQVSPVDVDDPVDPAIAAAGTEFYILWHQDNGTAASVDGLHSRTFAAGALGAINTTVDGAPVTAGATATNSNTGFEVWYQGDALVGQARGQLDQGQTIVSFPSESIGAPTLAPIGTGFVAAYGRALSGDSTGLMLSLIDSSGNLVRNATLLESGKAPTDAPAVATNAADQIAAVWSQCAEQSGGAVDGSGCSVMIQLFDSALSPLSDPILVNTTTPADQFDPAVTAVVDGFAVTWSDASGVGDSDGGIRARIIFSDMF